MEIQRQIPNIYHGTYHISNHELSRPIDGLLTRANVCSWNLWVNLHSLHWSHVSHGWCAMCACKLSNICYHGGHLWEAIVGMIYVLKYGNLLRCFNCWSINSPKGIQTIYSIIISLKFIKKIHNLKQWNLCFNFLTETLNRRRTSYQADT